MKIDSLETLLIHEMKDLYSAETQIEKALPKMEEAASSEELKAAFREHLEETKGQIKRLEEIFEHMRYAPTGEHCEGCEGLIKEGEEIIESIDKGDVRDAGLIGAAQRVEHYEMAGYGTAVAFARKLGHDKIADILTKTLEEEGKTDRILSRLAESEVNVEAMATA
ncbi:MAG: ferritin-like domain-containing protein [Verrucomicrobiota bacterium JB023]|nr:ferritin-like domain-containing protein [Verrucomicrobiota bacterium JB023]